MTTEEILKLIDECRARGVASFKADIGGHVEFTLYPAALGVTSHDPLESLTKAEPANPALCMLCQNAPRDGHIAGHCRRCSLIAAGVQ